MYAIRSYYARGHAKALAGIEDKQTRSELAKKCKEDMLTVRALEKICSNLTAEKARPKDTNSFV